MNEEDYLQLKLYDKANLILTRQVTRLEKELKRERELTAQKSIEIDKLLDALKKCIPFTAHNGRSLDVCEFCFDKPHTNDCEYVKLCGGNEE